MSLHLRAQPSACPPGRAAQAPNQAPMAAAWPFTPPAPRDGRRAPSVKAQSMLALAWTGSELTSTSS
eukprot:6060848-Alexandrium_andersonii.AAC.1